MKSSRTASFRLPVLLLSLGVLPGCASSGGAMPSGGEAEVNRQVQLDYGARSFSMRGHEDVFVHEDTLRQGAGDLLRQLAATYDEMGIPINTVNPEARLIGAVEARLRSDLGGEPLSKYLRCGSTITGSIADQYEVYLTVITQLEPMDVGGAAVLTHLRGWAVQGGRSGNNIRCATRGRLEREIFEHLQRKVQSAS